MAETYTTTQGDTWDWIAKKVYSNEKLLHHLLRANPDHRDVAVFGSGTILTVPTVTPPTEDLPLPPWKK